MMTRVRPVLGGFVSLVGVVVVVAGFPAGLAAYGGTRVPDRGEISGFLAGNGQFPIQSLLAVLLWVGVALWLLATLAILVELLAYWRHRQASRLPGLGRLQSVAEYLVKSAASVLLITGAMRGVTPAAGASPLDVASIAAPARIAEMPARTAAGPSTTIQAGRDRPVPVVVSAPAPSVPSGATGTVVLPASLQRVILPGTKVYIVERHTDVPDTQWGIAKAHLGNPLRWVEIRNLNEGELQPDGRRMGDPHWIMPGWILVMPADAVGVPVVAGVGPHVDSATATPVAPATPSAPAVIAPAVTGPAAAEPTVTTSAVTAPGVGRADPGVAGTGKAVTDRRPRPLRPLSDAPARTGRLVSLPSLPAAGEGLVAVAGVVAVAAGGVRLSRLLRERAAGRLRALRTQQSAQRKAGRTVLQPAGRLSRLELGVERAATSTAPVSDLLDSALRAMAVGVADWPSDQLPVVVAVHLCDAEAAVELQLAAPSPSPPAGFVAPNPYCWRTAVSGEELAQLGADGVNPCPCLVTVGASAAGQVLVDLERAGVLSVEGPPALVAGWLNAAAAELACDAPSHHVVVRLVGTAGALEVLPDVEDLELAELPAQLDSHRVATAAEAEGSGGTFELRVRSEGTELYSPMVAVVAGGSIPDLANLSECAPPDSGVAVIAAGPVPGTRWRLRLTASESRLDRVGLVMDRVSTADAPALSELLAVRANVDGVADVVELRPPPAPPAAPGGEDVEQGVLVAAPEGPGGDSDLDGVTVARPRVLVLGDRPHVTNWARTPTVKDGPVEEVVVRLTIADGPVSAEQLYDQIWASRVRFREGYRKLVSEGVSRARLCLGRQYIPNASKGMYRIDLASDLGDFRRLAASADRSTGPAEELALLGQALALVTGTPFKVVTSGSYDSVTIDAGALPAIQRLVSNAAHQAVQLALRLAEVERASWAADKGLLVAPVSEQLWQDRALAAEAAEDDEAIDAIHRRAVEATGGLSAETEEWFAQLVARRRSTRQWRVRGLSGGGPNGNGSAGEEKVGRRG